MTRTHLRISPMGNESLAKVENCCCSSPAAGPRPLASPTSLCAGAEKAESWVGQDWFLSGMREVQSAGDICSRRVMELWP